MNKSFKVIAIVGIVVLVLIIAIIITISVNSNDSNSSSSNTDVTSNIENITYTEITDIDTLSTKTKNKISKLKGVKGNFVLEYGEETIVILSKGFKTQQSYEMQVAQISEAKDKGQFNIGLIISGTQQSVNLSNEKDRYLYKIIKIDAKFDANTICYASDNQGASQRLVDSSNVESSNLIKVK